MYRAVGGPYGENFQDNHYNDYSWRDHQLPGYRYPDRGHARSAPREPPYIQYNPTLGIWHQGHHRMQKGFKSTKYWARPVDGKRRGVWGRLKDAFTDQGPDVFVVMNGDRRTLMRDMPHRPQWSYWQGPNWDVNHVYRQFEKDFSPGETHHFDTARARQRNAQYNFATRRFENAQEQRQSRRQSKWWTDAHWETGARDGDRNPLSYRTHPNTYTTRVPWWAGIYPGGRPNRA